MPAKVLKTIGINCLVLLGLLLLLEGIGQAVAAIRPSYDVLFLEPDEVVGWKQVPNLAWQWAGLWWYASDFSVAVQTNPLGFRDLPREFTKPPDVRRVALLGDSFIEAVQVPLPKTASQILERRLNGLVVTRQQPDRWEVLNFGISDYSVGQYLLAWEQYASKYNPDYVAAFVAGLQMKRTVRRYEYGGFGATRQESLWIRPTFRILNGELVREPARDFGRFVQLQKQELTTEFGGRRSRPKEKRILTLYYARILWAYCGSLMRRFGLPPTESQRAPQPDSDRDRDVFAVNLKVIEELGSEARKTGARLAIVDASQYLGDGEIVAATLQSFCARHGFGYIPVSGDLFEAERDGVRTRWRHDSHLNEAGNRILADALYRWIATDAR